MPLTVIFPRVDRKPAHRNNIKIWRHMIYMNVLKKQMFLLCENIQIVRYTRGNV